ncbi:MAG: VOC family protein [Candidatus Bathyarchaeia archaeon]
MVQIGIIAKDVEETARKLGNLIGIGPFRISEPEYRDLTYRWKTGRFKVKIGLAMAGAVQIELAQPLSGKAIYGEYVKRKGYGLHHVTVTRDDLHDELISLYYPTSELFLSNS